MIQEVKEDCGSISGDEITEVQVPVLKKRLFDEEDVTFKRFKKSQDSFMLQELPSKQLKISLDTDKT